MRNQKLFSILVVFSTLMLILSQAYKKDGRDGEASRVQISAKWRF